MPDFPFAPVDWHVHALLFGYVPAVLAGFLLTAVPNWTGRLPVLGWPLAGLAAIWIAGRSVTTLPTGLSRAAVAAVDLAVLLSLAALIGREIMAGRNWRKLKVLLPLSLVLLGQALAAGPATVAIYLMVLTGALIRIAGPDLPGLRLVAPAGLIWTATFALFVATYGPLLLRRRSGGG